MGQRLSYRPARSSEYKPHVTGQSVLMFMHILYLAILAFENQTKDEDEIPQTTTLNSIPKLRSPIIPITRLHQPNPC